MAKEYIFWNGAYHDAPRDFAAPKGAVRVPRLPGAGEVWDAKAGAFVLDEAILADHVAPAGHIAAAHAVKQVEASMILSGLPLTHGLIADEAAMTGQSIDAIARAVAEHCLPMRRIEAARRSAKFKRKGRP